MIVRFDLSVRPFIDATGTLRPTPAEILAALAVRREENREAARD